MSVQCGNPKHPNGPWHPAASLPFSWDWRARFHQWRNKRRWGCSCDLADWRANR